MPGLADVPEMILQEILEYLNVLDSQGTQLVRFIAPAKGPAHLGIVFHKQNPDLSLFDAMRVCRLWRDTIFRRIFKEDVTQWSQERWQAEIDRFRSIERVAWIEIARRSLCDYQEALFHAQILGEDRTAKRAVCVTPIRPDSDDDEAGNDEAEGSVAGPSGSRHGVSGSIRDMQ